MLDLVDGLPVHPLVVHAIVVLLPAAVLGTIAIVVKPAWRQRYGWLLVGVTALGTVLLPVATSSGEALERHVGDPGRHAALGEQLIWVAIPLLACDIALVWLAHRRPEARTPAGPSWLTTAVAGLAVIAALATGVQTVRVGDSGARQAWAAQVTQSTAH